MAGAPARVLVVEEDPDGLRALTVMFERAEFAVIGADHVEPALEAVRQHRVDCVVVDVAKRGHVGWQVLQRLRELSDVPVLVLTEGVPEADRVRGLLSGADDHLSKPVENEELVARIQVLLARRSAALDARIVRTASDLRRRRDHDGRADVRGDREQRSGGADRDRVPAAVGARQPHP